VNSVPRDREHLGALRGAVFTIVEKCSRSWRGGGRLEIERQADRVALGLLSWGSAVDAEREGLHVEAQAAGSASFIAEARRYKHVFGGAMRQAGIAAAGCLYALDHHVHRLVEDHARARRLAEGLAGIPGIAVSTPCPETNMVFFEVVAPGLSNAQFLDEMLRAGIRMGQVRGKIRAVTHLDVTSEDIELAVRAAADIVKSNRRDRFGNLDATTRTRY